jgi:hypothetical protein
MSLGSSLDLTTISIVLSLDHSWGLPAVLLSSILSFLVSPYLSNTLHTTRGGSSRVPGRIRRVVWSRDRCTRSLIVVLA